MLTKLIESSFFIRCACDECVKSREEDSLRHSQSRINAYRALSASSLIALSSRDPVLTAFRLSWELRRMSRLETEFRADYNVRVTSPLHTHPPGPVLNASLGGKNKDLPPENASLSACPGI